MRAVILTGVIVLAAGLAVWWPEGERDLARPTEPASAATGLEAPTDLEPADQLSAAAQEPAAPTPVVAVAGVPDEPTQLASLVDGFHTVYVRVVRPSSAQDVPEQPIADARVELGLGERTREQSLGVWMKGAALPARLGPSLTESLSDDDGRCVLRLPLSTIAAATESSRPWLRVSKPEHLLCAQFAQRPTLPGEEVDATRESWLRAYPPGGSEKRPLVVRLQPGVFVDAQLLGPDDTPVEGVVKPYFRGDDGRWSWDAERTAETDGRVTLSLTHEAEYVLVGTGRSAEAPEPPDDDSLIEIFDLTLNLSEPFHLRFDDAPSEPLVVSVRRGRTLRGRVLDSADHPVGGLDVRAKLHLADEHDAGVRPLAHAGRRKASARTDADGRFEVLGLSAGRYTLTAITSWHGLGSARPLGDAALPADGTEHLLRLDHPHLAIHLRTAAGDTYAHEIGVADSEAFAGYLGVKHWYDEAFLVVAQEPEAIPAERERTGYVSATRSGVGEFRAEVTPGQRYVVGVLQRGMPWRPRVVDVPEDAGRIDLDLVVPELVGDGTLALDVLDAHGTPIRKYLGVRLLDSASGTLLFEDRAIYNEEWPLQIPAPAGRYLLQVESIPQTGHHGGVMHHRAHGGAEQPLELVAGEVSPVTLRLGTGARLALTVIGEPNQEDRAAASALLWGTDDEASLTYYGSRVTVALRQPGRSPVPVEFHVDDVPPGWESFRGGGGLRHEVPLGSALTSELVTAGTYTLVATLPGGRELRREVELFDGVTTDVTLEFE